MNLTFRLLKDLSQPVHRFLEHLLIFTLVNQRGNMSYFSFEVVKSFAVQNTLLEPMEKLLDLSSLVIVANAHLEMVKGASTFHPRSLLLEHLIEGSFLV